MCLKARLTIYVLHFRSAIFLSLRQSRPLLSARRDGSTRIRPTMPLTHTKDLFAKALKGKYALGAFNVNNMELLQAIIEACEEEKAPVMLQISKGARQYANPV